MARRWKFSERKNNHFCWHHQTWGSAYGLGFIGAAVYYLQQSTSFWTGVLGLLKAMVWPAFVVYKLLGI